MRRWIITAVIVAAACTAVILTSGYLSERGGLRRGPDSPPKVLIVGIDGLDWERTNRLADEGLMPNVARLRREGSSGVLRSIHPFVSPTVWTTMATGRTEKEHGIVGFTVNRPKPGDTGPTTSNMRKVKAVWQILSSAERTVGVIGWLVTYPADPVNGFLVSSHVTLALASKNSRRAPNETEEFLREGVYPPDIWEEVAANCYNEEQVPESVLEALLEGDPAVALEEEPIRTTSLSRFYAGDMTSLSLARHFMGGGLPDFGAVYFRGCDMASHFFWRYMEPETWRTELPAELVEALGPVVERYYAVADSFLGEMMELADDNTVVVLCSDHGFAGHRGYDGFEGGVAVGVEMHRAEGIVFMRGPGIVPGGKIEGAGVLDITPTVLALSGLPVARDMSGRPLTEAMERSFLESYPIAYVESYETGGPSESGEEPVESPVDDEIKEMLRSLGYIN